MTAEVWALELRGLSLGAAVWSPYGSLQQAWGWGGGRVGRLTSEEKSPGPTHTLTEAVVGEQRQDPGPDVRAGDRKPP